jgi:hypothetical protein
MLVVLFSDLLVPDIMHWKASDVFLPVKLKSRHVTFTVLVWCKTQPKKNYGLAFDMYISLSRFPICHLQSIFPVLLSVKVMMSNICFTHQHCGFETLYSGTLYAHSFMKVDYLGSIQKANDSTKVPAHA